MHKRLVPPLERLPRQGLNQRQSKYRSVPVPDSHDHIQDELASGRLEQTHYIHISWKTHGHTKWKSKWIALWPSYRVRDCRHLPYGHLRTNSMSGRIEGLKEGERYMLSISGIPGSGRHTSDAIRVFMLTAQRQDNARQSRSRSPQCKSVTKELTVTNRGYLPPNGWVSYDPR